MMQTAPTTALFVPTYGRPHRLAAIVENVACTTAADHRLYFVVEADDRATRAAAEASGAGLILNRREPSYSGCINSAFEVTDDPFFFAGADDLVFRDGWLEASLEAMDDPRVGVVGPADEVHANGDHATHFLVRRSYIEREGGCLDGCGPVLYPYRHNYTDWELLITAKIRGAYRFCPQARTRHEHPGWDRGGRVNREDERFDETYAKGNASFFEDTMTLARRSRLFLPAYRRLSHNSRVDRRRIRRLRRYQAYGLLHRLGIGERGMRRLAALHPRLRDLLGP